MRKALRYLHRDERGMEVLQVVMILAVSSIVLLFLKFAWFDIKKWFKDSVNTVLEWQG